MSKAADIKRASNELLEKIAKAQQTLEAQKKALMEKNSAILAKAEEERRAQQKAEQEQARAEYEAQRAREEAEALAEAAKEEAAQASPVQEEPVAKPKAEEKAPEAVPAAQTERPRKEAPKPEERGFKRPSSGYQNNGARPRREEGAPPAQGRQPFRANKDGAAGEQRKARPQQSRTSGMAAAMPVAEKERVSNYDPNKKMYRKNHENSEQTPKNVRKDRRQQVPGTEDEEFFRVRKPKKEKKKSKRSLSLS